MANLEKLESMMSLGNCGIIRLVKYCFILEKNENVHKTGYFSLHFSDRGWKIEASHQK